MSELQSNTAFHLSKNPRYHYRPFIVLPPSLLYCMETLTFWCAMRGDLVPFKMSAHPDTDVNDLKKQIKEAMALRDVADTSLVLWKVF